MEIWLDTVDLSLIQEAKRMGILHGVTTNPSILAKSKLGMEELLEKILLAQDGPVAVQVTEERAPEMIRQGEALFAFSNRIVVKVPVTGEGLQAIHALHGSKIPTMATVVFDENQVLLAALAGAAYIAPYFSRICEDDVNGVQVLKAMMRLLAHYHYTSKLLAASLRTGEQVKECADIGLHAVTLNEQAFATFIEVHPFTKEVLKRFSHDWQSAPKRKSLLYP